VVDIAEVYDNSGDKHRLVLTVQGGIAINGSANLSVWAQRYEWRFSLRPALIQIQPVWNVADGHCRTFPEGRFAGAWCGASAECPGYDQVNVAPFERGGSSKKLIVGFKII
jgi:hypothetical protein